MKGKNLCQGEARDRGSDHTDKNDDRKVQEAFERLRRPVRDPKETEVDRDRRASKAWKAVESRSQKKKCAPN